jgi:hypothetical protein
MPSGWEVVGDLLITGTELAAMEQNLGAKLTGVRNTTFEVSGKRVKVNTLIAANAAAVVTKISAIKPIEFLLRKGLYVYEFVCKNDAIPQAREGRKHLAGQ